MPVCGEVPHSQEMKLFGFLAGRVILSCFQSRVQFSEPSQTLSIGGGGRMSKVAGAEGHEGFSCPCIVTSPDGAVASE